MVSDNGLISICLSVSVNFEVVNYGVTPVKVMHSDQGNLDSIPTKTCTRCRWYQERRLTQIAPVTVP